MKHLLYGTMFGMLLFFVAPATYAGTAELISGGDTLTVFDGMQGPDESVALLAYTSNDAIGTSYDLTIQTDEQPLVVVVLGELNQDEWTWDESTKQVTLSVSSTDFGEDNPFAQMPEEQQPESFLVIGIAFASDEGQEGPPAEAQGMYMTTNVLNWEMVPPETKGQGFGFILTGTAGRSGVFRFFVPNTLIDWMEVSKADLVLFEDSDQAVIDATELDNGMLFEINATFADDVVSAQGFNTMASSSVSKTFTAKGALPVSIAATDTQVSKNASVRLFGWLKAKKKGQKVVLQQKTGPKQWEKVAVLTTKAKGYYTTQVNVKKTSTYRFIKKRTGKATLKSPQKTVTVN